MKTDFEGKTSKWMEQYFMHFRNLMFLSRPHHPFPLRGRALHQWLYQPVYQPMMIMRKKE